MNVHIVSLGCPKNLVDSEVMLALLVEHGYQVCEDPGQADLLLINTCGFIQSAVEEAIDEILDLSRIKEATPETVLVVTGCLVQRYGQSLTSELPEVDLFIGTEGFDRIVDLVAGVRQKRQTVMVHEPPRSIMNHKMARRLSTPAHRAYLKISEGCSNRCTYCMIPAIRGPLRSRPMDDVVAEAAYLAEGGIREATLVGQDLTAYGHDLEAGEAGLENLLTSLLASCDIDWFRLLYLYPDLVSDRLLKLMARESRLLSYLDIPIQHVSDQVLKRMGRPFDSRLLHRLFERIHALVPDVAVRTTIMVGFPGETDGDVEKVAEFLRTWRLNHVGIFAYSNEEGCAAYNYKDQCPEEVKQERFQYLMELQAGISLARNKELVGRELPVLVEGVSGETELLLEGRTMMQAPDIDGCVYITEGNCRAGEIVRVRIDEAHPYDLVGGIIS